MQTSESLLDDFDAAWARTKYADATVPEIKNFRLPQGSPGELEHFENLIEIDLEHRWRIAVQQAAERIDHGKSPSLGDYLTGLSVVEPEHTAKPSGVFSAELVAEAYQMALSFGQPAVHDAFIPYARDRDVAKQLLREDDANRDTTRSSATSEHTSISASKALERLPDFQFEGVLGRGGKGIVCKARQISINRIVAIKTLRTTDDTSGNDIKRLRNEAKILGSLNHPNIVTVYCLEQTDDECFPVMEYVSGNDLSIHLKNGAVSSRDAAEHMRSVARAIPAAHPVCRPSTAAMVSARCHRATSNAGNSIPGETTQPWAIGRSQR